ncbi:endoribonuclease L-PSP [Shewanella mangrovi]|uniref:Endoribonuclease L-PSP n=1 Tax=Shewanella mangrovi TaxID=1515746 RepID=A0A094JEV1_9GAMM|nr:RidA family protein [Shewanella mangrovi]KFZ36574.1 endoribonuclease L-PSP [Shewanella mangrovi]
MDAIEQKLSELGLVLPPPLVPPDGVVLPFSMVRVLGNRALISGHGPQNRDGSLGFFGKVGDDVSTETAYQAAQATALSILASLKRELGSLERISRWGRFFGMVASHPGFQQQPTVINGFSDLIIELYGQERGQHSRTAVGMAELPFGICVEIEGEVELLD